MKEKVKLTAFQKLKKVINLRTFFVLILLLTANSFAWFAYATRVDNTMDVHVRAWRVLFESGDSPVVDYINVDVPAMFPGMEEFFFELTAHNRSDVPARLSYEVLEVRILGDTYVSLEGRAENGEVPLPGDLSSEQLVEKLANDFPFSISITVTADTMGAGSGTARYEIRVNWPFEGGDDALDTQWGIAAFDYREANPGKSSIQLRVKVSITQAV